MADQKAGAGKNVAAQHHGEMAAEHDQHGHELDAEHRQNTMPEHNRETKELRHDQRWGR